MTKYAKKILEIVESSYSHMTAEQVFEELRKTYPTVVLATVYNNLNRLWETHHDHFVCEKCGRLLDVDLGDLTAQLEQKAGIPFLSYDLKLLYVCEDCKRNSQQKGM